MSGHNKWSKIKHQKAVTDKKKSKVYSKFSRALMIAAREGGGDPDNNLTLSLTIERAKSAGVPNDNIERAIRKGTGEEKGENLQAGVYEGFGPANSAFIIEAATDNINRTVSDVRAVFSKNNGQMGQNGSVAWMFERSGLILAVSENNEEAVLTAIDAGAKDVKQSKEGLEVHTKPVDLMKVKQSLEQSGAKIENAEIVWLAKQTIDPSEEDIVKIEKLIEALEDLDDVVNVFSNLE